MEMLFGLHPTDAGTQKLSWYMRNICISVRFFFRLAQTGLPFSKDPSSIGSNQFFLLQGSGFGNPNEEQACTHLPWVS